MAIETPMREIRENLLFTKNGQCWAFYLVPPAYIHKGNYEAKENHRERLEQVHFDTAAFVDTHLQMLPTDLRLEERFQDLEKDFDPKLLDVGKTYNQRTIDVLKDELGTITENTFLFGVRITNLALNGETTVKQFLGQSIGNVSRSVLHWLGFNRRINESEYASYSSNEEDARLYVEGIGGRPVSEEFLYYLTRFHFIRGLTHNYEEEVSDRSKNIAEPILDTVSYPGYIKINDDLGESFVTFLPITRTPDSLEGIELFQWAQEFSFNVEVQLKERRRNKALAMQKIGNTKKTLKQTDQVLYKNNDTDEELLDGLEELNDLSFDLQNKNHSLIDWMGCYVVAEQTIEACREHVKEVKEALKSNSCRCVQPQADQLALFYKFLPGRALSPVETKWLHSSTHKGLSELQFGISQKLGTNIGPYIGRIALGPAFDVMDSIQSSRFMVLVHAFLANEGVPGSSTESPHIYFSGATGQGKSFLMKLFAFYLMFLKGQILMTDPKTEVRGWFEEARNDPTVQQYYPEFEQLMEQITYITLDPDDPENHGVLDPLNFLNGSKAKDSVMSIIGQLFPKLPIDVENEVRRQLAALLDRKKEGKAAGLMEIVEGLAAHEDDTIRSYGENMALTIEDSILQLVFSDGHAKGLDVDNKFTVLQIQGLDLPDQDEDPEDWTESDRKAVAIMSPLASFCQYFGMRDKHKNTTVIFDEAWTLAKAKGGKKLIKGLRRVGRSFKNQLLLVSQSVSDATNEDDIGNFGLCFAFDEPAERPAILAHMGLEPTKENLDLLADLKKGQCLFKDMYNRVGVLSVDCLFPEWALAFKTSNKSHSAEAERKYAS
jgi:hypothetical protein